MKFKIKAGYKPAGDQPKAIKELTEGFKKEYRYQTLLGVTGSGKTFTMAHVIEAAQKPTLVIAPNKTLAAQLCNEFKEFFPDNSVEYFVSYYDYYQPEAYVPQTDTYIEKDASINEEIDKLRHSATSALFSRKDVVIVASVSCIYNLGSPEEYLSRMVMMKKNESYDLEALLRKLIEIHYERNELNFVRGKFRVRGDVLEVFPSYDEFALHVEMFGDKVEKIHRFDPLTGEVLANLDQVAIYPATHFLTSDDKLERALVSIKM